MCYLLRRKWGNGESIMEKVYTKFVLKQPEVVKTTQWKQSGDHPLVKRTVSNSVSKCPRCGQIQLYHGQITTDGRWYHVCPDDYILEYEDGRIDVVKPEEFKVKYKPWIPCNDCSLGCDGEDCIHYEEFMKEENV
jgi:hypothetical protein